jgi:hypothetical protein
LGRSVPGVREKDDMTRGRCAFKEVDVKRAVKAVEAAGKPVRGVRFMADGGFEVVVGAPATAPEAEVNPWDKVLKPIAHE